MKLRDDKLHKESNCTLPAVATPPESTSNDDIACDGMEAYHLSQLDHLLCHDVAAANFWMFNPQMNLSHTGHFGRAPPVPRWNQSRGFVKRNRPGQFADRRDGLSTEGLMNNEFVGRRPKVMNRPQRGNSMPVPNNDDAGNTHTEILM